MNKKNKINIINFIVAVLFATSLSYMINSVLRLFIVPSIDAEIPAHNQPLSHHTEAKPNISPDTILNSGFFKVNYDDYFDIDDEPEVAEPPSDLRHLTLLGTITGSRSFAFIKNRTESTPEMYELNDIVFGYKLIAIKEYEVNVSSEGQNFTIEMYGDEREESRPSTPTSAPQITGKTEQTFKQTLSRASIQQQMQGNMDNMLRGLRVGPHREDGQIVGYRLFQINSSNILFQLGARSGDIIRRINGHPIDSTDKLFTMWQSFMTEPRFVIDIQRGNSIITYDFTITD